MIPRVSIIILNWNASHNTIECLESLYKITYQNYDVIVVDNGSEDESIKKIVEYAHGNKKITVFQVDENEAKLGIFNQSSYERNKIKDRMILIKNSKNLGFSGGNNEAIKFAINALNPNYILLLNNDTVVDVEFLGELVKVGEENNQAGVVGPTVFDYYHRKVIQSAGVKINWNTGDQDLRTDKGISSASNKISEVDYVSGCALLAKSALFEMIGYLDERFFSYWEETDWCIRAHNAGYKVLHASESKIWHKGGFSGKKASGLSLYYLTRNKFWFMKRHATKRQYCSFLIYFFGYRLWHTIGYYIIYRKDVNALMIILRSVKDGIKGTL